MMMRFAIAVLLSVMFMSAKADMPEIVGGPVGTFYSVPAWMPGYVAATNTPGNDHSYVTRTSIRVPSAGIVYRDGTVTNVPLPTFLCNNVNDYFESDVSQSHVDTDEVSSHYIALPNIDLNDMSWWAVSNESYILYYYSATNWQTLTFPYPIYSVKAFRSDEMALASIVASHEADYERLYYASQGQTNTSITAVTNMFQTHRMISTSVLSSLRDSVINRCQWGPEYGGVSSTLMSLPGGILNDPTSYGVLHWWSSTLFDLDRSFKLLPTFDWSKIEDVQPSFTNSAVNFLCYEWYGQVCDSNPNTYLLKLGSVREYEPEYASVDLPFYHSDPYLPYCMTNWFEKCLQSGGPNTIEDDVKETFTDSLYGRRLPMVLCGINQLLSMQDRTIHIPKLSLTCQGYSKIVSRNRQYSLRGYATVDDTFVSHCRHLEQSTVVTNDTSSVYDYSLNRVFLTVDKTAKSSGGTVRGTTQIARAPGPSVEDVEMLIGPDMRGKDPSATNYIFFTLRVSDGSSLPIMMEASTPSSTHSYPVDLPLFPLVVEVSGSASYTSTYDCSYPTNCVFALGASQPGVDGIGRTTSRKMGIFSALNYDTEGLSTFWYNDAGTYRCKAAEASYTSRGEMLANLGVAYNGVVDKLIELCPVNPIDWNANAPVPSSASFADFEDGSAYVDGARSGYFRVVNYGTENQEITWCTKETDTQYPLDTLGCDIILHVEIEAETSSVGGGCPYDWKGFGNISTITQVDWNWNNMKLIKENQ